MKLFWLWDLLNQKFDIDIEVSLMVKNCINLLIRMKQSHGTSVQTAILAGVDNELLECSSF